MMKLKITYLGDGVLDVEHKISLQVKNEKEMYETMVRHNIHPDNVKEILVDKGFGYLEMRKHEFAQWYFTMEPGGAKQ